MPAHVFRPLALSPRVCRRYRTRFVLAKETH
jgi:hypothetical protein